MIGMKKNIFALVSFIVAISFGFISCKGIDWDREESLKGMSSLWAYDYVGSIASNYEENYKSQPYDTRKTVTVNDTIAVETFRTGICDGDSLNIKTTIVMIDSVLTVTTDGYRMADNLTAHIFTVDPGVVNCNGKVHIDFYLTDGMIPWAWTEIAITKDDIYKLYRNGNYDHVTLGWY